MQLFDTFWHKTLRRPHHLSTVEWGYGPITIVLVHGIAASGKIWKPLLQFLDPAKYRVIAPDLLGFGSSPKPQWSEYTIDDHVRAVMSTLKKRHVRQPVIFIGHSMGCLIATHMATLWPRIIKSLILYEPPLLGEIPDFPKHTRRSQRYKTVFEFIASHPQLVHVESRLLWRIARKLWGTHMSKDEWLPFERSLRNTVLEQLAYDELRVIQVPTDIVYGRLDLVVIRKGIERIFAPNKNIKLHLVTDFHGISSRSAKYLAALLDSSEYTREYV